MKNTFSSILFDNFNLLKSINKGMKYKSESRLILPSRFENASTKQLESFMKANFKR